MNLDKIIKKAIEYPYWVFLIMLNHTWDLIKAVREAANPQALLNYYKNYNWTDFLILAVVSIILLILLRYLRRVKNEINSLSFHLKAENREFNGNYIEAYFHAVSALTPTYNSSMFQSLREQFQIIKNCLGRTTEGEPKLVKSELENLKITRQLDIEDVLKYIDKKDTTHTFNMDIVQIRQDIANLPDIREIRPLA